MQIDKELGFSIDIQPDGNMVGRFTPVSDSHYFQGHFPGYPIVPGIILLEVSLRMLAKTLEMSRTRLNIRLLSKVSFLKPVFPDDHVEIKLVVSGCETKINGYCDGETVFRFITHVNN